MVAEPTEQQVTVMVNGKIHIFEFTDERLPPAAPVQMSQFNAVERGTDSSVAGPRPAIRGAGQRIQLPAVRGAGQRIKLPAAPKRPLPVPDP